MKTRIFIAGKLKINRQGGFTYVMVMVAVVLVGLMAGVATTMTSHIIQVDREAELLFRGQAYQKAIKGYYDAGPQQAKVFPRSLEDLVQDPRSPGIKRHLRTLYPDPMGKGEWILVRAPDGGVSGVFSKGEGQPLKVNNFPTGLESLEGKRSYTDWVFQYIPSAVAPQVLPPAL